MFYAGDEFCNTQFGNNNAYCQDNEISWLDWSRLKKFREIHDYVRDLIAYRMKHNIIRHKTKQSRLGFPDISIHNSIAWNDTFKPDDHVIGVMFAGRDENDDEDAVFISFNAYWESCPVELPNLPADYDWHIDFYTNYKYGDDKAENMINRSGNRLILAPRSAVVASIRKR